MLALTGPRVSALTGHYNRKLELTGRVFARSHAVIARTLAEGKSLTRSEIRAA